MIKALQLHWPEYLIEMAGLGLFMVSACGFSVILFHPNSPVLGIISHSSLRRVLMGIAMGSTAIALIYSTWGKRSGAHFNPVVTFTFYRLGKVEAWDAIFYVVSQFVGGLI